MLMIAWKESLKTDKSIWLHNCKYIDNGSDDCITIGKVRDILVKFGHK